MATYQCPKGHTSTDPTYCSECGALIGASTIAHVAPAAAAAPGADVCPVCQTPRAPGARFCEVCRYDFEAGAASTPAAPAVASASPSAAPVEQPASAALAADTLAPDAGSGVTTSAAAATTAGSAAATTADAAGASAPSAATAPRLNIVVVTDPSLAEGEDEELRKQCPTDAPELVFPLDLDETLVGRRSDGKKIFPEIDLNDPGVSHRQLKFLRQPDGSFAALELGSANGTRLNGVALRPGLVTPVAVGDELLVGLWTRLQLRPR